MVCAYSRSMGRCTTNMRQHYSTCQMQRSTHAQSTRNSTRLTKIKPAATVLKRCSPCERTRLMMTRTLWRHTSAHIRRLALKYKNKHACQPHCNLHIALTCSFALSQETETTQQPDDLWARRTHAVLDICSDAMHSTPLALKFKNAAEFSQHVPSCELRIHDVCTSPRAPSLPRLLASHGSLPP